MLQNETDDQQVDKQKQEFEDIYRQANGVGLKIEQMQDFKSQRSKRFVIKAANGPVVIKPTAIQMISSDVQVEPMPYKDMRTS